MKKTIALLCSAVIIILLCGCDGQSSLQKFTDYSFDYFDTATTIIGYETDRETFNKNCEIIKSELEKYHKLFTIYNRYDGLNNLCEVNRQHSELQVDSKITELVEFSRQMYNVTNGRVNIAMGSVLKLWHDCRDRASSDPTDAHLPSMEALKAAAEHTDISKVELNKEKSTICLPDTLQRLDVGAVAKGYAVECVAQWMLDKGISGYMLNVGGNVRAVGKRADGKRWDVGIENPDTADQQSPYIEYIALEDMSLVISGDYQRFYYVDGKRYHHIIDPDTLMPAEYFRSVSVICKDSGVADALSTALFCMSYEQGVEVAKSQGVEVMWVLPDGSKRYTDGFKKYVTKPL